MRDRRDAVIVADGAIMARTCEYRTMQFTAFPSSQKELIRAVRGARSQAEFARDLKVDRSTVTRYENETLGVPTNVINHCLLVVAAQIGRGEVSPIRDELLEKLSAVLDDLERVAEQTRGVKKKVGARARRAVFGSKRSAVRQG